MPPQLDVLYINGDASKPQCSVYEAGKNYFEALSLSSLCEIEYIDFNNTAPKGYSGPSIMEVDLPDPSEYDLAIFNYASGPMSNIPLEYVKMAKKSMAITNDMYYESPWGFDCAMVSADTNGIRVQRPAEKVFDFVGFPDPTYGTDDPTVCVLPRVCPRAKVYPWNHNPPIISTYGFPSPEKQLHLVTQIINNEFDKAIWRMHFPVASHQGGDMPNWQYNVFKECESICKPGIKMEYSTEYFSRDDLIGWLAESDLNVFLHHPDRFYITKGALPASIDLAISAQRPIAFSDSMENRHVMAYQPPYPQWSFKETMYNGHLAVLEMYGAWSPANFAETFDNFIKDVI